MPKLTTSRAAKRFKRPNRTISASRGPFAQPTKQSPGRKASLRETEVSLQQEDVKKSPYL